MITVNRLVNVGRNGMLMKYSIAYDYVISKYYTEG